MLAELELSHGHAGVAVEEMPNLSHIDNSKQDSTPGPTTALPRRAGARNPVLARMLGTTAPLPSQHSSTQHHSTAQETTAQETTPPEETTAKQTNGVIVDTRFIHVIDWCDCGR